jgi:hypothetical protein
MAKQNANHVIENLMEVSFSPNGKANKESTLEEAVRRRGASPI